MPIGEVRDSGTKEPATLKTASGKGKADKGKHLVKSIHVSKSANGGFTAEHHYENSGSMGSYKDPDTHAFGPKDHGKLVKHLKTHLGLAFSDATGAAENHLEDK